MFAPFVQPLVTGAMALSVAAGGGLAVKNILSPYDYELTIVMTGAPNVTGGGKVEVDGADVGRVKDVAVRDGKALVRVAVRDDYAPLPTGTTARIEWKALLGERIIVIEPGPDTNPDLPDGGMVEGQRDRVELDQVLAALDAPTRAKLQSLTQQAAQALDGSETDLNETIAAAGPTLDALGAVAASIGQDGEAIKDLVTRLRSVTDVTTARRTELSSAVRDLAAFTESTATKRDALSSTLAELPETFEQARSTLGQVPATVDAAEPLVSDAAPLASKLRATSRDVRPVLQDLRPALQDLRPALGELSQVLQVTPALFDDTRAVLPGVRTVVDGVAPALDFLRPYTPEMAGWMTGWGSAQGSYDSYGNFARFIVQGGTTSFSNQPPIGASTLEGAGFVRKNPKKLPGGNEGQPWTDANGSGLR